jgi:hypothetical protein
MSHNAILGLSARQVNKNRSFGGCHSDTLAQVTNLSPDGGIMRVTRMETPSIAYIS